MLTTEFVMNLRKKNHIEIQQQPKNENIALVIFGATLILFNFRNEILFFVDACLRRLDQTNPVIMNGKKNICYELVD